MPQPQANRGRGGAPRQQSKKPIGKVIRLHAVRLSFPDLFEPQAFEEGQEPKYGCTFLLDPRNPKHKATIAEIRAEEKRMVFEMWGGEPAKLVLEYMGEGNDRTNNQTGEVYQGYENMVYITCKNKNQPLIVDANKEVVAQNDTRVYPGVYGNATINLFVQENKYGKAIRASVRGFMTLDRGEPFGAGRVSEKEFDDFDADDALEYEPEGASADADEFDDGL